MLGREVSLPVQVMAGLPLTEGEPMCTTEYAIWLGETMGRAFRYARERLGKSVDRQKKVYDRLAKDRDFLVGDWVWYFYTPKTQKFGRIFLGPYLVIRKLSQVTYVIQAERTRKPKVVHVDHLKRFEAKEMPKSWLE